MSVEQKPDTSGLLQQEAELAKAKAKAIQDLLAERIALADSTAKRLDAIAGELKALGWHRSRVALDAGAKAKAESVPAAAK